MHRSLHKMPLLLVTSALLVLGLAAPVAAQDAERPKEAETVRVRPDARPDDPEIAVLSLSCQARRDDTGNRGAVCRWRTIDTARGYQLWRIVDRGHRELVGTFDAKSAMARDDVPDDARLVRYVVLALDSNGDIAGRSRVAPVRFRHVDSPEIDARRVEVADRRVNVEVHRPVQSNGLMFVGPV